MVRINLLPDTRKVKIKEKNNRQLAISGASVALVGSIGVIILLFVLLQAQNIQSALLSNAIKSKQQQITQDIPSAQAIATMQSHLDTLNTLYANQVKTSNFFSRVAATSNNDVSIGSINFDQSNAATISGTARTYTAASKFAAAMRASNVSLGSNASASNQPDFSNVVLNTLAGADGKVSFTITAVVGAGVIHGK